MSTPKYSLETEHEVLETLMHFSDYSSIQVQKALLILDADCFYNADNRQIFALICQCFKKQERFHFVDILMLVKGNHELHETVSWLIDNYGKCHAGESNFQGYVNRLVTLSKLRKQLQLAERMVQEVSECASPEESQIILSASLNEIAGISYQQQNQALTFSQFVEDYYDGKIVIPQPVPTNCDKINYLLCGGIMPKSLIFAAAAPSTGKTGFAIYLLEVIARTQPDKECLFFSLEMEAMHIAMRHIGICAGKKFDSLSKEERLLASCKSKELKASVFDTNILKNGADIDVITTTARMRAKDNKISVIVVDYLGLVKVKGKFERNDLKLTEITDQLGQLAIELNCTVIVLSQINRQAAQRGEEDRCPWPHDAANSSGGHNSASYWLGLDRPEIYRPHEREFENQFVVKCRKNRFGDLHDTIYGFNGGTFGDYIQSPYARIYAQSQTKEQELFS